MAAILDDQEAWGRMWGESHPGSPLRAVDWRWRRAGHRLAGRLEDDRTWGPDDPWTRRAVALRCATASSKAAGAEQAALVEAHRLRCGDTDGCRIDLEAYLLAGLDDVEAGERCDLSPSVVAAYEAVFLDVRGVLDRPDSIFAHAIGPAVYHERPLDPGTLGRLIGYTWGPIAVDALRALRDGPEASGPGRRHRLDAATLREFALLFELVQLPLDTPLAHLRALQSGLDARRQAEASVVVAAVPIPAEAIGAALASPDDGTEFDRAGSGPGAAARVA